MTKITPSAGGRPLLLLLVLRPAPQVYTIVCDISLARHAALHEGDAMICRICHGRGVVYRIPEGVHPASVPHLVAPVPCPAPGCFGGEIACCEGDPACNDAETHFVPLRTSTASASLAPTNETPLAAEQKK